VMQGVAVCFLSTLPRCRAHTHVYIHTYKHIHTHTNTYKQIHTHVRMHTHKFTTYIHVATRSDSTQHTVCVRACMTQPHNISCSHSVSDRGWRRCIRCLKLQVYFYKRTTNNRALLRKMTCKDKASYASSTPCSEFTATHCSTLQCTATHCNTLQLTATHCNTLQHTATLLSPSLTLCVG